MSLIDAARQALEPCNKSCAPGYCYCEQIIQPEIKGHNAEPVAWLTPGQDLHLNNAEGFRFSDWTPLYTHPPRQWQGLTNEEVDQMASNTVDAWECARAVEEKLRAKNSTLVSK